MTEQTTTAADLAKAALAALEEAWSYYVPTERPALENQDYAEIQQAA